MPVGLCVMRTAESVVFTDCPPGPEERNTSISRSSGLISTSTSSASGSTATLAVGPIGLLGEVPRRLRIGFGGGEGPRVGGLLHGQLVLAVRKDDLLELGERLAELTQARKIGRDLRRRHLVGDLVIAPFDLLE